ncbi:Hypothetical protein, putative [Bodo saltans]|uniref:Uncharacterized protein n=1 Tax=Bodo saltans TaxID=75058 RepID=A0A0S4JP90_BODSA|nr:Hypothetical protein, putative [Bodo saltans]|eukprot:CUG92107.1 Hypothetical protein, putative [Bodo saltans]
MLIISRLSCETKKKEHVEFMKCQADQETPNEQENNRPLQFHPISLLPFPYSSNTKKTSHFMFLLCCSCIGNEDLFPSQCLTRCFSVSLLIHPSPLPPFLPQENIMIGFSILL